MGISLRTGLGAVALVGAVGAGGVTLANASGSGNGDRTGTLAAGAMGAAGLAVTGVLLLRSGRAASSAAAGARDALRATINNDIATLESVHARATERVWPGGVNRARHELDTLASTYAKLDGARLATRSEFDGAGYFLHYLGQDASRALTRHQELLRAAGIDDGAVAVARNGADHLKFIAEPVRWSVSEGFSQAAADARTILAGGGDEAGMQAAARFVDPKVGLTPAIDSMKQLAAKLGATAA